MKQKSIHHLRDRLNVLRKAAGYSPVWRHGADFQAGRSA